MLILFYSLSYKQSKFILDKVRTEWEQSENNITIAILFSCFV